MEMLVPLCIFAPVIYLIWSILFDWSGLYSKEDRKLAELKVRVEIKRLENELKG